MYMQVWAYETFSQLENEEGSRGKDLIGADEEKGFKMVLGTVELDNLLDVCLEIVGLVEESLSDDYEDGKENDMQ